MYSIFCNAIFNHMFIHCVLPMALIKNIKYCFSFKAEKYSISVECHFFFMKISPTYYSGNSTDNYS